MATFEILGYFREYYVDGKFWGAINLEQPDRETIGYCGRRQEVLDQDMKFKKGKLRAGTQVATILYPLNGRMIK
jgi:hypothetical protein